MAEIAYNMEQLLEQLKFEEGLRLQAYICPAGKKTIGYGHNMEANPWLDGKLIPDTIDEETAERLLRLDVERTIAQLETRWHGYELVQGARRDACINMAFQLGVNGFMRFTNMIRHLLRCEWPQAAREAMDSAWAEQSPRRAQRVSSQIATGKHYEVPHERK